MLDLLSMPEVQAITSFIGEHAKDDLTEKLLIAGVVWRILRRWFNSALEKFDKNATRIEEGLQRVAREVSDLKLTVAKDLAAQSERLGNVENGIKNLTIRVDTLEKE